MSRLPGVAGFPFLSSWFASVGTAANSGISYRDLEEMMAERGVQVDHTTVYLLVQRYAPMMEKRIRRYQGYTGLSWRVDETYIKVAGEWAYLYCALDSDGGVIDFMLSSRWTAKAAARFLGKALKNRKDCPPETINNTDQNEAYGKAIRRLKREGKIDPSFSTGRSNTSTIAWRAIMERSSV